LALWQFGRVAVDVEVANDSSKTLVMQLFHRISFTSLLLITESKKQQEKQEKHKNKKIKNNKKKNGK
jgi:hypothetical protein